MSRRVGGATQQRQAFAAARGILRAKRGRTERNDLAYAVYLGVMLAIIIGAPVVRTLVLSLAASLFWFQSHQSVLTSTAAAEALSAMLIGLTVLFVFGSAHTGPAHARLPDLDLLLTGPFSRGRVLGGSAFRVVVISALLGVGVGAILAGARGVAGPLDPGSWVALMMNGATVGILAAIAMLAGQISRIVRAVASALLAVLVLLHVAAALGFVPGGSILGPWSTLAFSALAPERSGGLLAAGTWLAFALVLVAVIPWLLGYLTLTTLRGQSLSWNAVSALALTGDLRMAVERLGAPVRIGRLWRWYVPRRGWVAVAVRDFVGIVRTPARSLAALVGVLSSGTLLGLTASLNLGTLWSGVVGVVSVTLVYASIGPWYRGLRAAAQTLGGLSLLPLTPTALILRHAIVPGLLTLCIGSLAAGAASALSGAGAGPALVHGLVAAIIGILLRILGSLKGPLPQRLLTPVPTPAGDMAGFNVLLWSLDGIVWAIISGAVLGALASVATMAALIASVVFIAALSAWSVTRLRSMSAS